MKLRGQRGPQNPATMHLLFLVTVVSQTEKAVIHVRDGISLH